MKIAEALLLRADMQKKLASFRERIARNAVIQEGESPHEDPQHLLNEAIALLKEMETLVFQINQTNASVTLADGRSLTAAIAHRDTLAGQHSVLQHAIASTQREPDRYSMSEIKWVSTLKVASLQKQADDVAKSLRELNAQIQETNWKYELQR